MDTSYELTNVKDDVRFNRDGTTTALKIVTFYLGKTGPYTERMTPEEYLSDELTTRVLKLQAKLRAMPE